MAQHTETEEAGHGAGGEMDHGATTGDVGVADAPGMPQLDFGTFPNQIFWLVVALVAIYFLLTKIALPKIAGILAQRQNTITNDIAAAEELKLKAQAAEETYQKALAQARAESTRISNEARAVIQADLNKAIARADEEISAKSAESEKRIGEIRAGAVESVEAVAKDTAAALVAALGQGADDARVAEAVDAKLKG